MADKYLSKARKLAKSSIYDGAEYLGEWKGYAVYEPTFSDDEPRFTGFPQFILAKGDTVRWTTDWEESRAIMDKLYSNEDEYLSYR